MRDATPVTASTRSVRISPYSPSPYPHRQVDNYAVVKIGYSAKTGFVRVAIDEKNTGNFHICLNERVDLKPDWWRSAHLGISASTGQLADNHDILSVETVEGLGNPDEVTADMSAEKQQSAKKDSAFFSALLAEQHVDTSKLSETEKTLLRVMEKLVVQQEADVSKLKREVEHTLVAVDDSLNNMIKKLRERGDLSDNRIAELESSLKNKIQSRLSEDMEQRLKLLEHAFDESVKQEVKKSSGTWIVPFLLLVVVIVAVMGFSFVVVVYVGVMCRTSIGI